MTWFVYAVPILIHCKRVLKPVYSSKLTQFQLKLLHYFVIFNYVLFRHSLPVDQKSETLSGHTLMSNLQEISGKCLNIKINENFAIIKLRVGHREINNVRILIPAGADEIK